MRTDPSVCRNTREYVVSNDWETQTYIQGQLGPDTLQLRVDGAERLVLDKPTLFDPVECSFVYPASLQP